MQFKNVFIKFYGSFRRYINTTVIRGTPVIKAQLLIHAYNKKVLLRQETEWNFSNCQNLFLVSTQKVQICLDYQSRELNPLTEGADGGVKAQFHSFNYTLTDDAIYHCPKCVKIFQHSAGQQMEFIVLIKETLVAGVIAVMIDKFAKQRSTLFLQTCSVLTPLFAI